MTLLAISLGAPLWFDLLNRFMIVRSGAKATEEKRPFPAKSSSRSDPASVRRRPASRRYASLVGLLGPTCSAGALAPAELHEASATNPGNWVWSDATRPRQTGVVGLCSCDRSCKICGSPGAA
jgi:hypothetical protein